METFEAQKREANIINFFELLTFKRLSKYEVKEVIVCGHTFLSKKNVTNSVPHTNKKKNKVKNQDDLMPTQRYEYTLDRIQTTY